MNPQMAPHRNHLFWPVNRTKRSVRIYVVEPRVYRPEEHASVFNAAISGLLSRADHEVASSSDYKMPLELDPFDLVTFPEALLTSEDLITALNAVSRLPECGCVHVGLRATSGTRHLFKVDEIKTLIEKLLEIPAIEEADLATFHNWIDQQHLSSHFNVGCLFMLDASGKLRVCLHPKVVRSKFEIGMLHERNMSEASMLSLVSLIPQDRRYLSITIQPLLCSDAINGDTDRPGARPLYAANDDLGDGSDRWPPDHIDLVSLATCTPQPEFGESPNTYSQWHEAFQDTFCRAARDDGLIKHHHSVFVLSNFRLVDKEKPGGLSGAFIPVPFVNDSQVPDYLTVSVWGHPNGPDKRPESWSKPNESVASGTTWSTRGYIACLRATGEAISARMIGFTVNRLPRHASRWHTHPGLTDFQLLVSSIDGVEPRLTFKQQE